MEAGISWYLKDQKENLHGSERSSSGAAGCAYLKQISFPVGVSGSFVTVIKICAGKLCCVNCSDTAKGTVPALYRNSCIKVFIAM